MPRPRLSRRVSAGQRNGAIIGRDANLAVFAGGNYSVVGTAAEAEGFVVVMGDFAENKTGPGTYNVGAIGVGMQAPLPEGSTFLAVRGNTDVADDDFLTAIQPEPNGARATSAGSVERPTGLITGQEVVFNAAQIAGDRSLRRPRRGAPGRIAVLRHPPPTGTIGLVVTQQGPAVVFNGAAPRRARCSTSPATSARRALPSGSSSQTSLPGATVLVNVLAPTAWLANVCTTTGGAGSQRPTPPLEHPTTTTVEIGKQVAWFGSTLVGNPASTATVTTSGYNGRFYATGNIIHGSTTATSATGVPQPPLRR